MRRHALRCAGRQIDLVEAAEPLGRFPAAGAGRHRPAAPPCPARLPVLVTVKRHADRPVGGRGAQAAECRSWCRKAVAERERRDQVALGVEPFIADRRALGVIRSVVARRCGAVGGASNWSRLRGEGRGQVARRIDLAEQHIGDRRRRPRCPGYQASRMPRDLVGPGHQHRPAGFQHDHRLRVGGGDRGDQRVLIVGQRQRHVERFARPLRDEDDRDIGVARQRGGRRGGSLPSTKRHRRARRLRRDRRERRRRDNTSPAPARSRARSPARRCRRADRPATIRRPPARPCRHGRRSRRSVSPTGDSGRIAPSFFSSTMPSSASAAASPSACGGIVDRRVGDRMVEQAVREHRAQDARRHLVEPRRADRAVGERGLQRLRRNKAPCRTESPIPGRARHWRPRRWNGSRPSRTSHSP